MERIHPTFKRLMIIRGLRSFGQGMMVVDEFLILIAYKLTYGREFHDHQLSLLVEKRHITFRWWMSFCDWGAKYANNIEKTEYGDMVKYFMERLLVM